MPSLKSHLVAFVLKQTRKKAFASPENLRRRVAKSRLTENHRPPSAIARRVSITTRTEQGFPVYDVAPPVPASDQRILYLHGGAFCFEMTPFHWALVAEMAERLGRRVTVPIYPLAPEHDFHAMFAMVDAVYRRMLDETPARDIVFMGDSAGGNMALVLTMMAAEAGVPTPARHVLISPGLDMTMANPDVPAAARLDPWLDIPGGLEAVRMYAAGIDFADWRISPFYGDLTTLPKTLVFTGTRDLLYPDTLRFADRAKDAGVDIEIVVGQGMIHVWPLIDMPEARLARDRMVAFLSEPSSPAQSEAPTASSRPFITD